MPTLASTLCSTLVNFEPTECVWFLAVSRFPALAASKILWWFITHDGHVCCYDSCCRVFCGCCRGDFEDWPSNGERTVIHMPISSLGAGGLLGRGWQNGKCFKTSNFPKAAKKSKLYKAENRHRMTLYFSCFYSAMICVFVVFFSGMACVFVLLFSWCDLFFLVFFFAVWRGMTCVFCVIFFVVWLVLFLASGWYGALWGCVEFWYPHIFRMYDVLGVVSTGCTGVGWGGVGHANVMYACVTCNTPRYAASMCTCVAHVLLRWPLC